jgi:chromosome segregation ATPase
MKEGKHIFAGFASLILAIYAPILLFFLAERFREDNLAQDEAQARANADLSTVKGLAARLGISPADAGQTIASMTNIIANHYENVAQTSQTIAQEAETLRPLQERVGDLERNLQTEREAFSKANDLLAEITERLRQEREAKKALQDQLEQAQERANGLQASNTLRTEKGAITTLLKKGEIEKAQAKVAEINARFSKNFTIDLDLKEVREAA